MSRVTHFVVVVVVVVGGDNVSRANGTGGGMIVDGGVATRHDAPE